MKTTRFDICNQSFYKKKIFQKPGHRINIHYVHEKSTTFRIESASQVCRQSSTSRIINRTEMSKESHHISEANLYAEPPGRIKV